MERLYEIRDELKQLDFHSYNSLGVVEQYFRCRLWVDLSRACFTSDLLGISIIPCIWTVSYMVYFCVWSHSEHGFTLHNMHC